MKKIYKTPAMLAVTLQHQSNILDLSMDSATGEGVGYGGGSSEEAHTKESKSIWDEEW